MAEQPYYEFDYLVSPEREKIVIVSAEELPRQAAPADYYPEMACGPCVYEDADDPDELQDFYPGVWWRYYAGGNNRPHWVLRDWDNRIYLVECVGWGGQYEVGGPDLYEEFANAYDAFWTAEQNASKSDDAVAGVAAEVK